MIVSNAYEKNDMGGYFDRSTHFKYSDSTIIVAWELSSLAYTLSGIDSSMVCRIGNRERVRVHNRG